MKNQSKRKSASFPLIFPGNIGRKTDGKIFVGSFGCKTEIKYFTVFVEFITAFHTS
jgi:hypothetical protein